MSNVWDFYGSADPYYGVMSAPEFRAERLDDAAKARFFEQGRRKVAQSIEFAEGVFGPVALGAALDYGCGVGRLSRALAERFAKVIAVDISDGMLKTARGNLAELNVTFEHATSMTAEPVDFLLSRLVFQHIPPKHGVEILEILMKRVRGAAVIDLPIRYTGGLHRRVLRAGRKWFAREPVMPMYRYDLNAVMRVLEGLGCATRVQIVPIQRFDLAMLAVHRHSS